MLHAHCCRRAAAQVHVVHCICTVPDRAWLLRARRAYDPSRQLLARRMLTCCMRIAAGVPLHRCTLYMHMRRCMLSCCTHCACPFLHVIRSMRVLPCVHTVCFCIRWCCWRTRVFCAQCMSHFAVPLLAGTTATPRVAAACCALVTPRVGSIRMKKVCVCVCVCVRV